MRKSLRLQAILQFYKQFLFESNYIEKMQVFSFSSTNNNLESKNIYIFIVSLAILQRWSSSDTTQFSDLFKTIRVFSETKTKAKKTKSWIFFFSNSRSVFFETITNFFFKLHYWVRTEEKEKKSERY